MSGIAELVAVTAGHAASDVAWPVDLWLDRGGFWTNRLQVVAENKSGIRLDGFGVGVKIPGLYGRNDLRITDVDGELLQFSFRDGMVVFPVSSEAGCQSRYFMYWGNPAAMEIPGNSWMVGTNASEAVKIETGSIETLSVATVGETDTWIAGSWLHRVPIRIANFSSRPLCDALFRFRLSEVTRGAGSRELAFSFNGMPWTCGRNGSDVVFHTSLPPRTIAVFYAYVKPGSDETKVSKAGEIASSDAVLPNDTGVRDEPKFPAGVVVRFAHIGDVELPPSGGGGAFSVAAADTASLVFPETPVKDEVDGFVVKLARNECETLQLAVRSPVAHSSLECRVTPPRDAAGRALDVEPGWAEYVFVDAPSAFYVHDKKPWMLMYPHVRHPISDGWSGWWPDPIDPGGKTSLAANKTKAFRLLVRTSFGTPPGEYRGDTYKVHVWDFALPKERRYSATFDVRGLSSQKERGNAYSALRKYGVEADQSCRTLSFVRDRNGNVACDFAEFDRLTEEFFVRWGFTDAYFPRNPFSLFTWSRTPHAFLGEEAYEKGETDRLNVRPAYKSAYQAALSLFWNHLKAKGWERRFTLFMADEPHLRRPEIMAQTKAMCDMVHEVDPAIPIYVSTWRWHEDLAGRIDVWGISASGGVAPEKIRECRARGARFWFTTDAHFTLDTPYLASELCYPLLAYFFGVEKQECWNCINYPPKKPWKYGTAEFRPRFGIPGKPDRWVRVPVGDGVLLYPQRDGSTDSYVPTVRIDAIRDGLETHEYLRLLEKDGSSEASAIIAGYRAAIRFPNAGGRFSTLMLPNPSRLGGLRETAGNLLDGNSKRQKRKRQKDEDETRCGAGDQP